MQEYIFSPKKIFYRKNDFKSDRPTLVFIHGISGSSAAWSPYEKAFENKYNILTFDLRGHGKSWKPKKLKDYTIDKFAEDLFELVQFLKIKSFVLIGHSFGVLVALDFTTKHMNMVEKIVFLSPNFAPNRILSAKFIKPFLSLVKIFDWLPLNQSGRGHVDYSCFKNTGDWNIPRMIEDIGKTSLRVYLYGTKQTYKVDYEKFLEKINVPSLIIHGKKDTIFPIKYSFIMQKKIKNSQLVIIENSNHILVLNNFPEVSKEIEKFINPLSC